MKKIICLCLTLCVLCLFCGCGAKNTSSDVEGVDVEYFVKLGKFENGKACIGTPADELIKKLSASKDDDKNKNENENQNEDGDGEPSYTQYELNGYDVIADGDLSYYCPSGKSKITNIVSFGESFGFDVGSISIEIKNYLKNCGFDTTETALESKETFFLPNGAQRTGLKYTFGDNTVCFVFEENALCATVISSAK